MVLPGSVCGDQHGFVSDLLREGVLHENQVAQSQQTAVRRSVDMCSVSVCMYVCTYV